MTDAFLASLAVVALTGAASIAAVQIALAWGDARKSDDVAARAWLRYWRGDE